MRKRWPWLLLVGLVLALAASLALRSLIDADRLARWLDGWLQQQAGLRLEIGGETAIRLRPRPAVMLQEVRLSRLDDGATLFSARRFELELPYRALWSEGIELHRLRLVGPEFALDRLLALDGGDPGAPPGLPALPRLNRGLLIEDGRLLALDAGGSPALRIEALELATGPLLEQEAFEIELRGLIHEPLAEPLPLTLRLDGIARQTGQHLRLDPLKLRLWPARRATGTAPGRLAGWLDYGPAAGSSGDLELSLEAPLMQALGLPAQPLRAELRAGLHADGPLWLRLELDYAGQRAKLDGDGVNPARILAALAELDPARPLDLLGRLATLPAPLRIDAAVDAARGEDWALAGLRVGLLREPEFGPPAPDPPP